MKLTKDDFDIGYVDEIDGSPPEYYKRSKPDIIIKESKITVEQILKNQEDAEKWNRLHTITRQAPEKRRPDYNDMKIVERLKKRIEELEEIRSEINMDFPLEPYEEKTLDILQELQKILKGKK